MQVLNELKLEYTVGKHTVSKKAEDPSIFPPPAKPVEDDSQVQSIQQRSDASHSFTGKSSKWKEGIKLCLQQSCLHNQMEVNIN